MWAQSCLALAALLGGVAAFGQVGVGVNGPLGHGWSVQGTSAITRCPSTLEIDGSSSAMTYGPADRLCLDGQRLVRTDANGAPQAPTNEDAAGISGTGFVEFRTEKDSFVRVRAYGTWGNSVTYGPWAARQIDAAETGNLGVFKSEVHHPS